MTSYIADNLNILFQRTKKYPILGYYKNNIFYVLGQYLARLAGQLSNL